MKVKVGDRVYDAKDQPVMVILEPQDKINIAAMPEDKTKYCGYPDGYSSGDIEAWMAAEESGS
jgi:hypothetical protein